MSFFDDLRKCPEFRSEMLGWMVVQMSTTRAAAHQVDITVREPWKGPDGAHDDVTLSFTAHGMVRSDGVFQDMGGPMGGRLMGMLTNDDALLVWDEKNQGRDVPGGERDERDDEVHETGCGDGFNGGAAPLRGGLLHAHGAG